jgi:hypothetical protein
LMQMEAPFAVISHAMVDENEAMSQ